MPDVMHPVRAYAVAALLPAGLVALAALRGGVWVWVALVAITLGAWALDKLIARPGAGADPGADPDTTRAAADRLSVALALVHFILLALVVRALAGSGLGLANWLGLYVAAALFFGQVSSSNAHELIHRTDKRLFALGKWVYISLLFGHHASAHTKVHHRFAASQDDPNSARAGESFYAFAPRAWRGGFAKGYEMERADVIRRGNGGATPYVTYVFGAIGFLLLSGLAFGWAGLAAHVALAAYAQTQLLLVDYVQHYGLARTRTPEGKLAPIGPAHSWNSGHWFTSHMMLNAPRHSDHHAHPARAYPALALPAGAAAPRLPASLPVMATLALYPAGWRRVMDRALDRWHREAAA